MAKGQILQDSFEQLAELGVSTVKKTGSQVKKTLDPRKVVEKAFSAELTPEQKAQEEMKKNKHHTPLDFQKLQESYKKQDEQKENELKSRLFQLVREGERKAIGERKQEEQEKEKIEMQEEHAKKKQQEEKHAGGDDIPQGKVRRSIFSKKKVAQRQQTETRASAGKQ